MIKSIKTIQEDGFYGAWYPCDSGNDAAFIMMHKLAAGRMAEGPAKWFRKLDLHTMILAPVPEHKNEFREYPVDRVEKAVRWMKAQGIRKIGIAGQSQTAMLSLLAASLIPAITLTIALTPCDFIMEATQTTNKVERPIDASFATWRGHPFPFHRFHLRGDALSQRMQLDGKATGNMFYARELFDESENANPLAEEQMIPIEKIQGKVLAVGARDDAMWDTARYISRMENRLSEKDHECVFEKHIFEHGTHYVFPQGMVTKMLPASSFLIGLMFREGKVHKKQCRETRMEIDRLLAETVKAWRISDRS